jgi:hypothetical protein
MTHASLNAPRARSRAPRSLPAASRLVRLFTSAVPGACLLAALAFAAGCTHVAAYDRGRLAHPSMTDELGSVASAHVQAVQEGASGGGSVAESGCGCN